MNKLTIVLLCVALGSVGVLFALPEGAYASMACSDGNCYYVACSNNADCGANQFTGGPSCQANNQVYQNYITYTCNNGGTANAFCSTSITQKYQTTCLASQTCRYGLCMETGNPGYTGTTPPPTTPPPAYGCYPYGCPFGQSCVNNVCQNTYTPPTYPQYPTYPTYPTYNAYASKGCFNKKYTGTILMVLKLIYIKTAITPAKPVLITPV